MDKDLQKFLNSITNPSTRRAAEQFFKDMAAKSGDVKRAFRDMQRAFSETSQDAQRFNTSLGDAVDLLNSINAALKGQQSSITKATRAFSGLVDIGREMVSTMSELDEYDSRRIKKQAKEARAKYNTFKREATEIKNRRKAENKSVNLEEMRAEAAAETNKRKKAQLEKEIEILAAFQEHDNALRRIVSRTKEREILDKATTKSAGITLGVLNMTERVLGKLNISGLQEQFRSLASQIQTDISNELEDTLEKQLADNQEYQSVVEKINSKEAERQKILDEINERVEKEADTEEKKIELRIKYNKEAEKSLDKLIEEENTLQDQADTIREKVAATLKYGKTLNTIGKTLKGLGTILVEIFTDPLVLLGLILDRFDEVDKANVNFQRITGQNAKAIAGMNFGLVDSTEVLKTMADLSTRFGFNINGVLPPNTVGRIAESAKLLGLGAEEAAGMARYTALSGRSVRNIESGIVDSVNQFNDLNKTTINHQQIMQDVLSVSEDIAMSLGNNPESLGKAAAAARRLGMDLKRVDDIASSLMDFESSIEAELEAQLLTGGQINMAKARELALNNDLAGLAEEIKNNNALSSNFANANRIQQESMAKALGMSRAELGKMVATQMMQNGASDEAIEKASGMTAEQFKQLAASEKFQASLNKVLQAFTPLLDAAVPLVDLIAQLVKPIGVFAATVGQVGVAFKEHVSNPINKFFDDMYDKLGVFKEGIDGVGKVIGTVLGGYMAYKGGKMLFKGVKSMFGFGGGGRIEDAVENGVVKVREQGGGLDALNKNLTGNKGVLGRLKTFVSGKGMRSGAKTSGISRLANAFRGGGVKGLAKAGGRMAGPAVGAATAITSTLMAGKGIFDFFSNDKMRATGAGGFAESMGGTGMKILDTLSFGLTKKLTEMANITIPGMDTDDIADARAIFHNSGRDPDSSRMPMALDNFQLISDILANSSAYPEHIVEAAQGVDLSSLKKNAMEATMPSKGTSSPVPMATGGIVSTPTNAIVGEAGAEAVVPLKEFYAKMDELINVVKQGGDVYMDGNKVGSAMVLSTYKSN